MYDDCVRMRTKQMNEKVNWSTDNLKLKLAE